MEQPQQEYFYNVAGFVRQTYANGYGFLVPKIKVQETDEKQLDIYFHASALLDKELRWKDIVVGQRVEISCVVKTAKGYSAMGVQFVRPQETPVKTRKNRTGAQKKSL